MAKKGANIYDGLRKIQTANGVPIDEQFQFMSDLWERQTGDIKPGYKRCEVMGSVKLVAMIFTSDMFCGAFQCSTTNFQVSHENDDAIPSAASLYVLLLESFIDRCLSPAADKL
ncbi:hypothetical protein N7512_008134 [Penicillium capsulatum]|nr:hypothetical protein N7512_008134 [Penicillium capsulatum]